MDAPSIHCGPVAATDADRGLAVIAERFPLLLGDLRRWLAGARSNIAAETVRGSRVEFTCGDNHYLLQVSDTARIIERLDRLDERSRLVHLLHSPAALLQLLGSESFNRALQHQRYTPLLLLPISDVAHLRRWLLTQPPTHWPWPLHTGIVGDGPAAPVARQTGRELHALLRQLCTALLNDLNSGAYRDRATPAQVLQAGDRPLRVLAAASATSAYQQFCARDIRQGFSSGDVACTTLIVEDTVAAVYELLAAIQSHDPDVLLLNGLTRGALGDLPELLTVFTWDQDYVACASPTFADGCGPRDRLAVMVEDWCDDARENGAPVSRLHHLNLGSNTELYRPAPAPYSPVCDVLFVGNFHPFERYRQLIGFDDLSPSAQRLMLAARDRLRHWACSRDQRERYIIPKCAQWLADTHAELNPAAAPLDDKALRPMARYFRYRIAHMLVRELYIRSLADFNLRLFGRGWDALPDVARHSRGVIENGRPLVEAIHDAAIVLHLHTWTVHHPRLYDTAAAGGFLLVGRVPERNPLETVFEPGRELDSFGSIAELTRTITYWLDSPDERCAIGQAAAARTRLDHSMTDRMKQVIGFLQHDPSDS